MTLGRDIGDRGFAASNPNLLINGDFRVWQRGTSFSTDGIYTADRWKASGANTVSRLYSVTLGDGSVTRALQWSNSTPTTPGILYRMEAESAMALVGKKVTLSFWAKSLSGTEGLSVNLNIPTSANSFGGASLFAYKSVWGSTAQPSTWTKYVMYYDTLPEDVKNGLQLVIYRGATGSPVTNIAQVKLEVGTQATPFIPRPIEEEIAACQRYFCKSYNIAVAPGTVNWDGTCGAISPAISFNIFSSLVFPVQMFTTPTITIYSPQTGAAGYVYNSNYTTDDAVDGMQGAGMCGYAGIKLVDAVEDSKTLRWQYTAEAEL